MPAAAGYPLEIRKDNFIYQVFIHHPLVGNPAFTHSYFLNDSSLREMFFL